MEGDFPGEAQCFYEGYTAGGDVYEIDGLPGESKLYYKEYTLYAQFLIA